MEAAATLDMITFYEVDNNGEGRGEIKRKEKYYFGEFLY